MKERLQRIELLVTIPGPICMETPLSTVEITFLNKLNGSIVDRIQQGQLWQNC